MKGKFTFRQVSMIMLLLLSSQFLQAKVWRVNNNAGTMPHFVQPSEANASPLVSAGDTIYLEGSATNYAAFNLTKKLIFIGPGYLLAGFDGNTGLQFNTNSATVNTFIDTAASGSKFMGLIITASLSGAVDNLVFERCQVNIATWVTGSVISNLQINKCLMSSFRLNAFVTEDLSITNCMVESSFSNTGGRNTLFRNNVINNLSMTISNAYLSNNIFTGSALTHTSCTIKYNIATGAILPVGNNNQNSISHNTIFAGGNSKDGKFRLTATSPAIGAGEPINGVTPDCGMFGTPDPYRLSGIPAIPSIYELTVPASVPSTASSMTITVSTRSNN